MSLLIFDDDAAIGRLVARVAQLVGIDARAVTDSTAFAEAFEHLAPDIIVLDLQLGNTDGVEQLRLLADRPYTGSLILISGFDPHVLDTARTLASRLGLDVVAALSKPIRVDDLKLVLERLNAARQALSADLLMDAIRNDELTLEFQPVVSRRPKSLRKLEALVRWEHPLLGSILPEKFIPLAESRIEVIDALTDWVFASSLEACQVLGELGLDVPISLNVSAQNLHDLTLPDRLTKQLQASRVPAEKICLEITETAAFNDITRSMDVLSRIRLRGMKLSLDDFGTGFSSLKLLCQMPFTEIKIDQTFVRSMLTSRDARVVVKSIIDLAKNMEMASLAEGVETEEGAALLESFHVDAMQGYLFARPMPLEGVASWLTSWTGVQPPAGAPFEASKPPVLVVETEDDAPATPVPSADGAPKLSVRQLDVLQLLADGCSVKQIARQLGLAPGTVKVHLSLAYAALGAHNRIEAVKRAGLIAAGPAT